MCGGGVALPTLGVSCMRGQCNNLTAFWCCRWCVVLVALFVDFPSSINIQSLRMGAEILTFAGS